jgi:hypothetical protein
MYENGKIRPVETIKIMGGRQRRMTEGVNLTKIYYKHFCKCHNVLQYNIVKKKKKNLNNRNHKK